MYKLLFLSTLGIAAISPAVAGPIMVCEHPGKATCGAGDYETTQKNSRCEKSLCVANTEPPGTPYIQCDYSWGTYQCQVWPRGEELSYSYAATAGLQVSWSGPVYYPTVSVGCPGFGYGGALTVTVTSPYGLSSHNHISLPCHTTIEQ
ncbi:MAG: hypothetical protein R3F22_03115 [Lysobacteraceae bacterium]